MAFPRHNLLDKRFGWLVVKEDAGNRNGYSYWRCLCACGKHTTVKGTELIKGTSSCGCKRTFHAKYVLSKSKQKGVAVGSFESKNTDIEYGDISTRKEAGVKPLTDAQKDLIKSLQEGGKLFREYPDFNWYLQMPNGMRSNVIKSKAVALIKNRSIVASGRKTGAGHEEFVLREVV